MCTCHRKLADIRDRWQAGFVVVPSDSEFVAQKFIVPNLLTRLAAMFDRLFCEQTARLTIDYTFGDLLRAWSIDPTDPDSLFRLDVLCQQLDDEDEWGLPAFDPWRCIDRMLVLEAYVKQLNTAHDWPFAVAWQILADALPAENYVRRSEKLTSAEVDSVRKKHFEPALRKWLRDGGEWLHEVLTDLMSVLRLKQECRQVLIAVREALAQLPQRLLDQTKYVAKQRGEILENLRKRSLAAHKLHLPEPLDEAWFQTISAELIKRARACRPFLWDGLNLQKLKILMHWIDERKLEEPRRAPIDPLRKIALAPFSCNVPWNAVVGSNELTIDEVLKAWNEMLLLVRTRWRRKGYLPDWGDRDRLVEDLFCHPLMGDFSFQRWCESLEFLH